MRTLFIGALAANLVSCTFLPCPDLSAAEFDSKPVAPKVDAQDVSKSTNPRIRPSRNKAGARVKDTAAGKTTTPLPPAQVTADPVIEKAKASIAAMMVNPASAQFYNFKRAVRNLLNDSVDTICGYVKGKNASGGDTEEMPFLYIIRDDRDGEAYLVDEGSFVSKTVHGVVCK